MLDTVNDVLDAGDEFFQWLQDVDDGTKRFIITFSGVSAGVAGALVAIKSLTGAFAALAANPLVLGAVAAAAGIGLIVAAVNKANHRLEDAASEIAKTNQKQKELLDSFANGDAAKKLDAKTTKKLIELYPELSGEIKAYSTSVEEASEAVKKLNREKIAESAEGDLRKLRRMLAEVGETEQYAAQKADEYLKHMTDLSIAAANGEIKEDQIPDLSRIQKINRDSARERLKEAKAEYEAYFAELDAYLKTAGMTLTDDLRVIDLPKVEIEAPETGNAAVEEDAIKTWQEWFRKVTGVEGAFETGQEAGRLYAEGLASEAEHKAALSDLLGFDTRASEEIRAQMQKVADDIGKLLAVPAEKIDEKFSLADASVQALAQEYRRLAAAAEEAEKGGVVKKLEEHFDFCSGWSESAENVRNFFISNSILAKIYYKLWMAKKSNRLPLILMTSFRLLVISFFIVTVVHQFLTENYKVTLLLLAGTVLLLAQSRWLLNQYMKMEAQFLANLRGRKMEEKEEEKNKTPAE